MADYVCHLSVIQAQKTLIFGCSCAYVITFLLNDVKLPLIMSHPGYTGGII